MACATSEEVRIINKCLELILQKGVKVLDIDIVGNTKNLQNFCLPIGSSSSVSSLTSLKISRNVLPLSLNGDDVAAFKYLKVLHFNLVSLDPHVIEHLTVSCRLLKKMKLQLETSSLAHKQNKSFYKLKSIVIPTETYTHSGPDSTCADLKSTLLGFPQYNGGVAMMLLVDWSMWWLRGDGDEVVVRVAVVVAAMEVVDTWRSDVGVEGMGMASGSVASASVPSVESTFASAKRKSKDIGWEYGVIPDPKNLDRIKCTLCEKVNAINEGKIKKQAKRQYDEAIRSEARLDSSIKDDESLERGKGKKVELSNAIRKERMWMTKKYIARPALPPPTRYELSIPLLKEEVERTKNLVKRNKIEWKAIGCSIMMEMQLEVTNVEMPKYKKQMDRFGTELAISACKVNDEKYDPVTWLKNGLWSVMEMEIEIEMKKLRFKINMIKKHNELKSESEDVVYEEGDYESDGVKIIEGCGDKD
uniref:Uncharacterized protein n=1 Tax=Tanacetum cinerariifolium TaxID=118510 RepID=A0A6L2MMK2_TANCI|nr:hypothetical protein [Tanacetum cinerariifolium]